MRLVSVACSPSHIDQQWMNSGQLYFVHFLLLTFYFLFFSSRENANLEYLKNVILRYLLTDSESVRQQMVAAIATILEFSPQEVIIMRLFTTSLLLLLLNKIFIQEHLMEVFELETA